LHGGSGFRSGLWLLWLGTSSFLVTCAWARPGVSWFDLFLLRRLGGGFFGIVADFATIMLVSSGEDASLSSGLFDSIVGVWDRWCLAVCKASRI
jgi:hypothetical protein